MATVTRPHDRSDYTSSPVSATLLMTTDPLSHIMSSGGKRNDHPNKTQTTRSRRIILSIAALLATAAWFLIDQSVLRGIVRVDDGATTAEVVAAAPESASQPSVTADGYLAPTHYALLGFAASNTVATIHVQEGDLGGGRRGVDHPRKSRQQQAALAQATANSSARRRRTWQPCGPAPAPRRLPKVRPPPRSPP